jgi:hypothetical protein
MVRSNCCKADVHIFTIGLSKPLLAGSCAVYCRFVALTLRKEKCWHGDLTLGILVDFAVSFLSSAKLGDVLIAHGKALKIGGKLAFTEVQLLNKVCILPWTYMCTPSYQAGSFLLMHLKFQCQWLSGHTWRGLKNAKKIGLSVISSRLCVHDGGLFPATSCRAAPPLVKWVMSMQ